jgi:hypothetical protein
MRISRACGAQGDVNETLNRLEHWRNRAMIWTAHVWYFLGGVCLTNSIPHLVAGLSGRAFPTQFSTRLGVGLSSPFFNFVWGWTNAAVGYAVLFQRGGFGAWSATDVALLLAGSLVTGATLSVHVWSDQHVGPTAAQG